MASCVPFRWIWRPTCTRHFDGGRQGKTLKVIGVPPRFYYLPAKMQGSYKTSGGEMVDMIYMIHDFDIRIQADLHAVYASCLSLENDRRK